MEYVIDSVLANDFWNFVNAFALNLKYCMFQNISKIIELFPLVSYFSIIYSILVLLLRDCQLVKQTASMSGDNILICKSATSGVKFM